MWASFFKTGKSNNPLADVIRLIKDILIVTNDFLNLSVLDFIIDLFDKFLDSTSNSPKPI